MLIAPDSYENQRLPEGEKRARKQFKEYRKKLKEMKRMSEEQKIKEDLVEIMHNMSKTMGLRPFTIFGVTLPLGVPKHEFMDFLNNPDKITSIAVEGFHMDDQGTHRALKEEQISAADVITVARAICAVCGFLSKNVCPSIGG